MAVDIQHWQFTTDDYHKMGDIGIFCEDDRVELIEGEIIKMSPIGGRHAACITRLTRLLVRTLSDDLFVGVQNPVRLSTRSEPQPDVSVFRTQDGTVRDDLPTPAGIVLLIEVSDTTYPFDRTVKLPLYARAAIPEYWIIDIDGGAIERHTEPVEESYRATARVVTGQQLASTVLPEVVLDVDEVLGW